MDSHKLSTVAYAQGFIEDYIESNTQPLDIDMIADEAKQEASDENEHREQVIEMWRIISSGLDRLRKENTSLENKLALIDLARNTVT
jgi:hypothetical protein